MATIDLGRVTPIFHGDYDNTATYELNDLVIFNDDMYWHVSDTPTTGTDPTDATVWKLAIAGAAADLSIALAAFPTDTASGSIATIPDGADGIPVKALTVQIEPSQSGSGDPSPSNPRPITGWTGAEIEWTGKNLIDASNADLYDVDGQGLMRNATQPFVLASGTYTVSQSGTSEFTFVNITDNYAATGGIRASTPKTITITQISTCIVRSTSGSKNANQFINNNLMVEAGSSAAAYTPYTGTTYTVPFGQTIYGGDVDPLNGEGSDDLLTTTFSGFTSYTQGASFASGIMALPNAKSSGGSSTVEDLYCSMLKVDADPGDYTCRRIDSTLRCYFPLGTSQADAEALIDGMVVAYPAATPAPFTVDPIQFATLLGDNNVWADTGDVTLNYRADTGLYIDKKLGA